ncbi:hypothetical protein D9M68_423290 [compost metagenome]
MRGLGARRHVALAAVAERAGRAVAEGEDVVVEGGLQGGAHQQLVDPVAFQPVQVLQQRRRANAGRPHLQARRNVLAGAGVQAVGRHLADRRAGHDAHAELLQGPVHRAADPLGQRRQHARAGLDQGDAHVLRLDAVQPVGGQFVGGVVQFGGQLHAGRPGADYGHADLLAALVPGVGAQVVVEHLAMEAFGLLAGVEEDAVLGGALGAEVVGGAADGDHQAVVLQRTRRHQLDAVLVQRRGQFDAPGGAIQPGEAAELELEVVPFRLGDIVQLILRGVERAGGDFVQQGFPDVREVGVDQGDAGLALSTQGAAETGRELQPAGAAADNYDAM